MPTVSISVRPEHAVARLDRRLFGSFVEHLGRCVYGGIYEPGHPSADEDGFRRDVVDLVTELGVSTVRYPGGNFVSGYRWEDGVGPRENRPVRRDLAWHVRETNQIGLDEFAAWTRLTGVELMMAVNLGTRGIAEALDLLEYTNGEPGTALADQRVANGSPAPHGVRMWCLGNEMDGPWQTGYMTADEYGRLAARTGAAMKQADSGLQLVVCGSSGSSMPTFGEWERTVLGHAYDVVDYISCHAYYQDHGDRASFLASSVDMDRFITTVVTAADHVQQLRGSDRQIALSFDEWNVWDLTGWQVIEAQVAADEKAGRAVPWPIAPRQLEDTYTVTDAVVVGSLLITMLRRHDRVRAASLAQLVNVIAPIMTEPGGPAWRQTTFYPFALTSRLAAGTVLAPLVDCPTMPTATFGDVPVVDVAATFDDETGRAAVFLVNRRQDAPTSVRIDLAELGATRVVAAHVLHDDDPTAQNTLADPDRVTPAPLVCTVTDDGALLVELPPISWAAIELAR
ncbi:arabinosylfuranosidase ArfA [Cellulomonas citrea]|uniref:arabinosylfuranosidase ArfA n=1 Tax=Cellulomonas citrea TaxID=1909423 RepID=UPI001356DA29|nr:alpha-N-arabinofuranosidase [Cellulomonas citrea]